MDLGAVRQGGEYIQNTMVDFSKSYYKMRKNM